MTDQNIPHTINYSGRCDEIASIDFTRLQRARPLWLDANVRHSSAAWSRQEFWRDQFDEIHTGPRQPFLIIYFPFTSENILLRSRSILLSRLFFSFALSCAAFSRSLFGDSLCALTINWMSFPFVMFADCVFHFSPRRAYSCLFQLFVATHLHKAQCT